MAGGGALVPVWRDVIHFLIAVPCPRGEAAALDWSHWSLATAEWHQAGNLMKTREANGCTCIRWRWTCCGRDGLRPISR